MRRITALCLALGALLIIAGPATARVLRVGTYHGAKGQYKTIQAAVKAARPGDWILIAPGDYKTSPRQIASPKGEPDFPAGILITKRDLHLRGMNRNTVIVDGTRPGSAVCSRAAKAQNHGLKVKGATPTGLNGLMVYKAANVSIENLTSCNFLGGSADTGNEIWWNGGANSGKVGGFGYYGGYLNATSTYYANEDTAARYGIFSSNWYGGTWNHTYVSNFNDSGLYIGACQQVCDQTINHTWAEYNALGYSGSNSGGRLLVENSQFDNNEDGFDTNSQNGDNPPPQNGACPAGVKPPVSGAPTCWVFTHNYVHDNNNPNVPAAGSAAAGPVGTGMSLSGARNDTVMDNRFIHNDAWGLILVPYLDNGPPCTGGTLNAVGPGTCLYGEAGDHVIGNQFASNGSYGHPSNGDVQWVDLQSDVTNCYSGNTEVGGGSLQPASSAGLQTTHPSCTGAKDAAGSSDPSFLTQVLCDSQVQLVPGQSSCPPGTNYPRVTKVVMHPLPRKLATMPNPCAGVPSNPWCTRRKKT